MMTRFRMLVAVVAIVAAAVVAGGVLSATAERETIKVGMALSMTGKYDVFGKRELWGATMWADWVNAQGGIYVAELGKKLPVELIWYDDKSDKDTVVKMIERLIVEDEVDFILGPYGSGLNMAAAAVTERYEKLLIIHAGASDKIYQQGWKYVVGVLTPSTRYYKSAMEMLAGLEPPVNTIALATEDNPFTKSMRDGIIMWAEELGFEIVFDEIYPSPPIDLSPMLTQIKGIEPDAILASSHFRDAELMARQAAELRVYTKFFALGSAPSTTEYWDVLGEAANYHVSTSQWEPVDAPHFYEFPNWYGPMITGKEFNEWFEHRWGEPTDFRGAQMFQAGLALQWGIEHAGSLDTAKVREALNDMDIMTFYGACKIDPETGIQVAHEMVVAQWQDGKLLVVWPLALAQAELIYPMPPWEEREI